MKIHRIQTKIYIVTEKWKSRSRGSQIQLFEYFMDLVNIKYNRVGGHDRI